MKIIYALGNRPGAVHQLFHFLRNSDAYVKAAGYSPSLKLQFDHFDWCLDPVESYPELIPRLEDDFIATEPDLVITDGEPIFANFAAKHNIPLLKCSPLHLLDGVKWKRNQQRYTNVLEQTRILLKKIPDAISSLIYAPYGFLNLELKPGFEWITPYITETENSKSPKYNLAVLSDDSRVDKLEELWMEIIDKVSDPFDPSYPKDLSNCISVLSSGETQIITDALVYAKNLRLIPSLKDPETLLNALICSIHGIAEDLGQVELLGRLAIGDLNKSFERSNSTIIEYEPVGKLLHEKVEEIWESL